MRNILLTFFLVACTPATFGDAKMNIDTEQLAKLISLPDAPLRSTWSIIESGDKNGLGPNDWALVAILTFTKETTDELTNKETIVQDDSFLPAIKWYPKNFLSQLKKMSDGQYTTKSSKFSAEVFFSSPLINGYFIPIEGTNDIFIYLYTT